VYHEISTRKCEEPVRSYFCELLRSFSCTETGTVALETTTRLQQCGEMRLIHFRKFGPSYPHVRPLAAT